MNYKALISDIDGTLIPNRFDGELSQKVIDTVKKAKDKIHIGIATSRTPQGIFHLTDALEIVGPSIVFGGAQIIDTASKEVLWEQPIETSDAKEILGIARRMNITFVANDMGKRIHVINKTAYVPQQPLSFWGHALEKEQLDAFHQTIKHLPNSGLHVIPSWQDGKMDFLITHTQATKQHAILQVAEFLQIDPSEMIGIGDGANDLPLLMACGLKVAVGNAVAELKDIADYIAPPVEEDAIADVLEKFVL